MLERLPRLQLLHHPQQLRHTLQEIALLDVSPSLRPHGFGQVLPSLLRHFRRDSLACRQVDSLLVDGDRLRSCCRVPLLL